MLNEIKKILNRREFYFSFLIFFFAMVGEFIYKCYMFREVDLSDVVSAYESHILYNVTQTPFIQVYSLMLPILISVAAATMAYEEKKSNLLGSLYTRTSKKEYINDQYKAVFVTAFSMVLFCLLISLLLSLITFPYQGHFSYNDPEYERFLHANTNILFDSLDRLHPYINILIFIVLRALFAGAFASFAYGLSYIFCNKIAIIIAPFIFELLLEVALMIIRLVGGKHLKGISETRIFSMNNDGKLWVIVFIWLVLMFIGKIGINKGIRVKDEL